MIGFGEEEKAYESLAKSDPWTPEDAPTAWSETFRAALSLQRREENSDSSVRAFESGNQKRAAAIGQLGGNEDLAQMYAMIPRTVSRELNEAIAAGVPVENSPMWRTLDPIERKAFLQVRQFERLHPDKVLTDEALFQEFKKESAGLRAQEQDTIQRGSGFASFLGAGAGIMTDPFVLATLPLGIEGAVGKALGLGGKGVLSSAARTAVSEGAVGFATEIPVQAQVYQFKRELEAPWAFKDSAMNVLAAGLGGAAVGGVLGGGVAGAKKALAAYSERKAAGTVTPTPELEDAAATLEETVALHESNPLAEGATEELHEQAFETARAQEQMGQPVDVADQVRDLERLDELDRTTARIQDPKQLVDIDPLELKTDAKTFQFKTGGDAEGVTEVLRGVDRFDRLLAAVSLVWERNDGTRFIADGHQRVALARRAIAAGQDPAEVRLNAFVFREADGVSAIDVRRIAAVKNMVEGTGTALDAAKILRDAGKFAETLMPPLPPRSALVRQARGLANLDEEAFRQVINEVIPANYGALVGQATPDPKLQQAMIEVLRRTQPANETQARSIVDQVRTQGVETRTTEDLFGEQTFAESLYLERAQVLDEAIRASRKDQTVFGRLLSEEKTITSTGANRLDRDANLTRLQEAKDVRAQFSTLANARGPLSDALTAAARAVREGEQPGRAATAFLAAARREILKGDRPGGQAGRAQPGDTAAGAKPNVEPAQAAIGTIPRAEDLSTADRAIETRFADQLESDPDGAIAEYEKLPGTDGGRILNTDLARELSPDYVADRTRSAAVQEPASWLVKRMYARKLKEAPAADQEAKVLFTGGGTGAGKSTAIAHIGQLADAASRTQIVYDTNLNDLQSSITKIEQALSAGKEVEIYYVWRDPVESLVDPKGGALQRAMKMGRTVPLKEHGKTHVGGARTIKQLVEKYAGDERVKIRIIDNSHGKGGAKLGDVERLPDLDYNHVREDLNSALDAEYAAGRISESVYRATKGQEPTGPGSGQDGAGARGQPEPQRPRGDVDAPPREDSPDNPVKPGEKFLVFRASANAGLKNTNAGNADSVADFLIALDDFEKPRPVGAEKTDTLYVYSVDVAEDFGPYSRFNQGRSDGALDRVGREASKAGVVYSFPEGAAFKAQTISKISIEDLRARAEAMHGTRNFDDLSRAQMVQLMREELQAGAQAGTRGAPTAPAKPLSIDTPPRPIVRQAVNERLGTPDATRTGYVPDDEYMAVMAQYEDMVKDYGELAQVANEVNGELEVRSVRAVVEELDTLEDSLERIRLCNTSSRVTS